MLDRQTVLAKIDAAERETFTHLRAKHGRAWDDAGRKNAVFVERSPVVLRASRLARLRHWMRHAWSLLTRGCE